MDGSHDGSQYLLAEVTNKDKRWSHMHRNSVGVGVREWTCLCVIYLLYKEHIRSGAFLRRKIKIIRVFHNSVKHMISTDASSQQ